MLNYTFYFTAIGKSGTVWGFAVKVTEVTQPLCPSNVLISLPVFTSQTLIVPSLLPDAISLPSGEKVTE